MYLPRALRPLPARARPDAAVIDALVTGPLTHIGGPGGTYAADVLAAGLACRGRWTSSVWLRTAARSDAELIDDLTAACRRRWSHDADGIDDADPLADIIACAPAGATIVLEPERGVTRGVAGVLRALRPVAAANGVSVIVVSHRRSDRVRLPGPAAIMPAAALWPADDRRRADARLRADAARLADATPQVRAALETCVSTGYWHPSLGGGDLTVAELAPWVVPLEDRWGWLPVARRRPLARHLRRHARRSAPPGALLAAATVPRGPRETATVEVRMLGSFELRVDGITVAASPGHRGFAVLRYLLSSPRHAAARDEILEQFWPDVAPEVARNRLQVAVSGVRRALREVTTASIVEYHHGGYGIAPGVDLVIDVEGFEQALATAHAAERQGRGDDALAAYAAAARTYRGDFAADAPYEQWTLLTRETLRLRYVDALDRMSRLQLDAGRVDECIATAHRILDVDACREDAHRLLMRCYSAQGRPHQSLRQYALCARALYATLEVDPSAETDALRDAILAGSVAAA